MAGPCSRAGLIALLVACAAPDAPLVRAALHVAEPGEGVQGPDAAWLISSSGLPADAEGGLWVGPAGSTPPPGPWVRVAQDPEHALWARRELGVQAVAVQDGVLPDGAVALEGPTFRGWIQHGPAAPGGELVVEVLLQPPARTSPRPCLALDLGEAGSLDLGPLGQGRITLVPGAGPRPVLRHRARVGLPATLTPGSHPATLHLSACEGRRVDLVPPVPLTLELAGGGLPSRDDLRARSGTAPADAAFAQAKRGRAVLRGGVDGSLAAEEPPPLPRLLRGAEAWALLVLPVDPSSWTAQAVTPLGDAPVASTHPLAPLAPMLTAADASVVVLDAVATLEGAPAMGLGHPTRRTPARSVTSLPALGVDAVLLGPGADDAGPEGRRGTLDTVRGAGLPVDDDGTVVIQVGEGERATSVALVSVSDLEGLAGAVSAVRDRAQVVLVQVASLGGNEAAGLAAALDVAGADGGWALDGALGVHAVASVPGFTGLPVLGEQGQVLAVRWYVSPEGVRRLDVLGLEAQGGRWDRVRTPAMAGVLDGLAARAEDQGAWLHVGRTLAAMDVAGHGPDRVHAPAAPRLSPVQPPRDPAVALPAWCTPESAVPGTPVASWDGVRIDAFTVLQAPAPGQPLRLQVDWQATRALPAGQVSWSIEGAGVPWRATSVPCDGGWGFERLGPGDRVRDVLVLPLPEGADPAGPFTVQAAVRLADGWALTEGGERFVVVGSTASGG